MRVWRISVREYAPGLDGEGSRIAGGRWNSPGQAVVYTSDSLALAALEVLVHLPRVARQKERLPSYLAVGLDIPDALIADPGYAAVTVGEEARSIGDAWLSSLSSLALMVPSRVIPLERNILLNPRHPDMSKVSVALTAPFVFDDRLGE